MTKQMPLSGLPQAYCPIHITCSCCGHNAKLNVPPDEAIKRSLLRCSQCGARGRYLHVDILPGANIGG